MAFADQPVYTVAWLVDRTSTVYSLPLFYERLNEAINHPRTSIDDIAKIITEDQGLTARLLRLANSPLFGWFGKVDSINKAVTIIGTQQLRDLALAASVMGVFTGIPPELMSMTSFWRHSVACGIIARTLATWRREPNVERFFVAGILHDIGQLMMATTIPPVVMELMQQSRSTKL
ncbi:MAG: HDOD domain-containing protein, partial [Geobacter sp.]